METGLDCCWSRKLESQSAAAAAEAVRSVLLCLSVDSSSDTQYNSLNDSADLGNVVRGRIKSWEASEQ